MSNQYKYANDSRTFESFKLLPKTPCLFECAHASFLANEVSRNSHRLQYGIDEALGFDEFDWSQLAKLHPSELDPWRPIGQR